MKQHAKKVPKLKSIVARLMVTTLIVVTMASLTSSPPIAHAAKKYFADVDTSDGRYNIIKYCNERGAFGKKRGKDYCFHPDAPLKNGTYILFMYNMFHKKVGWGNRNYDKNAKKSWQWAQSNGIVSKKANPDGIAIESWTHSCAERMAAIIGNYTIIWPYNSNLPMNKGHACIVFNQMRLSGVDPINYDDAE